MKVKNMPDDVYFKVLGGKTKRFYKKESHTFTADAYHKGTNTIKEFQGCFYHGCPKCRPELKERYLRTAERKLI